MKKIKSLMAVSVIIGAALVAPVVMAAPANAMDAKCHYVTVPPKKAWWQCAPLTGTSDPGCHSTRKLVCS